MRQVRALWILCLTAVLGLTGCGEGRPTLATYAVTGTLTLDGKPVAGVEVWLIPQTDTVANAAMTIRPYGKTQSDGKYTLTSYLANDGAPAGDYLVIMNPSQTGADTAGGEEVDPETPQSARPKSNSPSTRLPMKYRSPATSDLKVTVKSESNTIDLTLKSR